MNIIRRRFTSNEVKDALEILDEIKTEFDCATYQIVRGKLEDDFLADNKEVVALVKQGVSPRVQVYNAITNLAGDLVESGHYHVYRGVLDTVGEELLRLFDLATDELVQLGTIDAKFAKKQKAELRKSIKSVG